MTDDKSGNTVDWPLLARYLANETNDDQRRTVAEWLAKSEANRQTFSQIQQRWHASAPAPFEASPASVWDRHIAPRLTEADETNVRPLHPTPSWWQRTAKQWRVAAAIAGLLLGSYALYQWALPAQPAAQVILNPVGKRSLITLPDGSRVWLNADSRLEFPKTFDGPLREVRLVGEAFFDVTHNPKQPFVIRLSTASIRVLGTSFNVRAYPGDNVVKTTVVTGRVAFVPNGPVHTATNQISRPDTLFILPNHHAVQAVQTLAVVEEAVVAQNEAAWKDNRLVFDQTPMAEVAKTLERWYGLTVMLDQAELANCPLTATFEGQPLREVMDLMTRTGQFQYTLTDKKLVIRGRPCL